MIKIEAIIRPDKIDSVKAAIDEIGVKGVTVLHAMGAGRQRGKTAHYRGTEYTINLLDKVKMETVVPEDMVDAVIEAICSAAFTGETGDGKIFLIPVADAVRIRTGERGGSAVS